MRARVNHLGNIKVRVTAVFKTHLCSTYSLWQIGSGFAHIMCAWITVQFLTSTSIKKIQAIPRDIQMKGAHSKLELQILFEKSPLSWTKYSKYLSNDLQHDRKVSLSPFLLNMCVSASTLFAFLQNHGKILVPMDPNSTLCSQVETLSTTIRPGIERGKLFCFFLRKYKV